MKWEKKRSKGLSPVIATIILSAVVISVGGAIWSFAQGASTVIANNYVNDTLTLMNEIIERFTVEHVSNSSDGKILHVWVYNYGDVDIEVDVYATISGGSSNSTLGTKIASQMLVCIDVTLNAPSESMVAIKVHSRRQNNAFYQYYVS